MTIRAIIAAVGLAATLSTAAFAQVIGGDYHVRGSSGDIEVLAGDMTVSGIVEGDIEAVAGEVTIDATVNGDIELAGGDIEIDGRVNGSIEVFGGDLSIGAHVTESIEGAGGDVSFSGTAESDVSLAGGFVEIRPDAVIHGFAELAGDEVLLAGRFEGDVEVLAVTLHIAETAVINGQLRHRGPEMASIAEGAQLSQPIEYEFKELDFGLKHVLDALDIPVDIDNPLGIIILIVGTIAVAILASSFILGVLAILIAPRGVTSVTQSFRRRPGLSILLGIIILPMLPIVLGVLSGILAATIVGIPLVGLIWVAYIPLHYLAFTLGVIAIGDLFFNRRGEHGTLGLGTRILSLFVATVVLAVMAFMPFIGVLSAFFVLCLGLGAWSLALFDRNPPRSSGDADRDEPARREKRDPVEREDDVPEESPADDNLSDDASDPDGDEDK